MAPVFTAQMSVFKDHWRMYVVLLNTTDPWPDFGFDRADSVQTFTERVNALSVLGFEPVPGAEWEWTENSAHPDDPASPITLLAALRVRSRTEGEA
ncbi:DUF6303 family protein [Streptomyces justiciae]|uniref:DUF6303 family protein n=1 Tax=Streptomyces justiciae TaxID=2780140 RepID=A0ABU3LTK4_9ACTN|nr:DUF6303 family protein [Streptomyces justiciae]MDT7842503.1 DUF6303 family protein [Streptomyces justiciae]